MFCEKCGAQNADGARFCASCGAMLAEQFNQGGENQDTTVLDSSMAGSYEQPYEYSQPENYQYPRQESYQYSQPDNYQYAQPNPVYAQPQRVVRAPQQRSVGAIVLYMIAGAIALFSILLPFLPQVSFFGETANVPVILFSGYGSLVYISGSRAEYSMVAVMLIMAFAVPMILQLVWAILSFARVRAAGVLGLIGSIIFINVSVVWAIILAAATRRGVTAVPYMMIVLGIAGMVLSIIQLAKKNRVR